MNSKILNINTFRNITQLLRWLGGEGKEQNVNDDTFFRTESELLRASSTGVFSFDGVALRALIASTAFWSTQMYRRLD